MNAPVDPGVEHTEAPDETITALYGMSTCV